MRVSKNKYRKAFLALHSSSMNQSTISIRRAIRKDFQKLNPSSLEQLDFLVLTETEKAFKERFEKTGIRWGNLVYNQILERKRFNPIFSQAWARYILLNAGNLIGEQISSIGQTAVEEVKREVRKNIEQGGDVVTDLTNQIKKVVNSNNFYIWQAERIARTETTIAMNTASDVAVNETGIETIKQWISAGDGNERPSHQRMNGMKVSKGGRFENGLRYAGDPEGSASEVVNCRCTTLYIPVE